MSETNQGHLLAIAMGPVQTRIGVFHGDELSESFSLETRDVAGLQTAILKAAEAEHGVSIVLAGEDAPRVDALRKALEDAGEEHVYRIGKDIEVPMDHSLNDDAGVEVSRLLCAFGAYSRAKQACVVVTVADAVAVDFVDGEGVFHGGVVAPGHERMMTSMGGVSRRGGGIRPLSAGPTGAVSGPPADDEVEQAPAAGSLRPRPFGRDLQHSRELGASNAIRGLVRHTVEEFAQFYGSFPQVVATGTDAAGLFGEDSDGLMEMIVPDLELIGILEVCKAVEEMRASGFE